MSSALRIQDRLRVQIDLCRIVKLLFIMRSDTLVHISLRLNRPGTNSSLSAKCWHFDENWNFFCSQYVKMSIKSSKKIYFQQVHILLRSSTSTMTFTTIKFPWKTIGNFTGCESIVFLAKFHQRILEHMIYRSNAFCWRLCICCRQIRYKSIRILRYIALHRVASDCIVLHVFGSHVKL